jgi:hypothetical protein
VFHARIEPLASLLQVRAGTFHSGVTSLLLSFSPSLAVRLPLVQHVPGQERDFLDRKEGVSLSKREVPRGESKLSPRVATNTSRG